MKQTIIGIIEKRIEESLLASANLADDIKTLLKGKSNFHLISSYAREAATHNWYADKLQDLLAEIKQLPEDKPSNQLMWGGK